MSAKHSVDVAEPSPSSQLLLVVHVTMQRAPVSARIMLRNVTRHSRARADLLDRLAPSLSGGFNLGASDPQCCDLICLWSGAPFLSVICQAHRRPRVLSTDGLELQVARRVRTAAASPAAPVRNGRSRSGRPSRRAAARRCRRGPSGSAPRPDGCPASRRTRRCLWAGQGQPEGPLKRCARRRTPS
jgi:hypothetical protein